VRTRGAPGRVHTAGRYVFAHGIAGTGGDPAQALRAAMADLDATLRSAGSALDRVERVTYYVRDAALLPVDAMAWSPRSSVVELTSLPDGVHVELEATAVRVHAA
jgi:enamine deaminase RidA (YjgF/YER057c/UK114 family)